MLKNHFVNSENIIISNKCGIEIIEKYKDDDKALLFIDPPYLMACNDFYDDRYTVNIY